MSSKNLQDVGNLSRTASAFKSSTSALTSTLTYAMPHLAGAIDILSVQQPDGNIKTSPFYVRFGKYSSFREKDRRVSISINSIPQSYTMQVGRTGEAYFVEEREETLPEDDDDDEGLNAAILAGMETPPNGYSDEDTPPTEEEFRSPFKRSQADVKRSASEPALATLGLKDSSKSKSKAALSSKLPPKPKAPTTSAPTPHPRPPIAPGARHLEFREMNQDVQAAAEDAVELTRLGEAPEQAAAEAVAETDHAGDEEIKPSNNSPIVSPASSPRAVTLGGERSTATPAGGSHHTGVEPSVLSYALSDLVAASPRVSSLDAVNALDTATAGGSKESKDVRTAVPPHLDLSLCWHLLTDKNEMSPNDVAAIFLEHKVGPEAFQTDAAAILSDPHLACRLGNKVYQFKDAQVLILASLAFGPAAAMTAAPPETIAYDIAIQSSDTDGSPVEGSTPRSSSWRGWLSFSWRSKGDDSVSSRGGPSRGEGGQGERNGVPRSSSAQDVVPPDQEAALLTAAAEGQASHVEVTEMGTVRRSPSGRRTVVLRKRGFVPAIEHLPELAAALHPGQNVVEFSLGRHTLRAFIYLVRWDRRLVISDVDGTITKSDVLGHLGHFMGFDWTHSGVTGLFAAVARNGYGMLFLSSRSIAQASITRDYLHSLKQDGDSMPHGAVIISPDGLFPSLYREVVLRRPEEFKIRALADIKSLFPPEWNPFVAGFGNRETDVHSYLAVGVPASRIFIINPKGELRKPSSAVITSSLRSLPALRDLVDSLFPAIHPTSPLHHGAFVSGNGAKNENGFCTNLGHDGGVRGTESPRVHSIEPTGTSSSGDGARESSRRHAPAGAERDGGYAAPPSQRYLREDTPVREEYNTFNYWKVQPSYVVDDDDLFEDAVCGGPVVEENISISSDGGGGGGGGNGTGNDVEGEEVMKS